MQHFWIRAEAAIVCVIRDLDHYAYECNRQVDN
jgi:hypothetical protein